MLQCFPNIIIHEFDSIKVISKLSKCKKKKKGGGALKASKAMKFVFTDGWFVL